MKLIEAKVVVLGTQGVGKTSIVSRYTGKVFNKHVSPTIGATFFCCTLSLDDHRVKLKIWDTAGQERFRAMVIIWRTSDSNVDTSRGFRMALSKAPMYYRNANAAFLVYDITCYESYMEMKTWVEELQRNIEEYVFICIVGNKSDLTAQRQVKPEDAREYAESIGAAFVETSAVTDEAIETAFIELSRGLIRMSLNTTSSSSGGMRVFHSVDGISLTARPSATSAESPSAAITYGRRPLGPSSSRSHLESDEDDDRPPAMCC